jgi:HJR/Mrr/RecB family endonuclease
LKSECRNSIKKNAFGKIVSDNSHIVTQEFLDSVHLPQAYYSMKSELDEFYESLVLSDLTAYVAETVDSLYVPSDENVSQMSGLEFEAHVRDLLQDLGWDACITKASGDQGIDVIAWRPMQTLSRQRFQLSNSGSFRGKTTLRARQGCRNYH